MKPNAFKDAVIGSSLAALVVLAQRGKKRPELRISALVMLAQRGKRSPKQTLQRIVLPPLQPQLQQLVSHVRLVISIGFVQLWRCNSLLMVGVLAARRTARRSTDRCVRLLPVVACLLSDMFKLSSFGLFHFQSHLRPGGCLRCGRYDRQGPTAPGATLCNADITMAWSFLHAESHYVVLS